MNENKLYNLHLFGIFILVSIFLFHCSNSKSNINEQPVRYASISKAYYRDSLYISTTVWQFIDKKVDIFDFYKQEKIDLKKVRIDVDSIFYSPDSLKIFSFVITTIPDDENKTPNQVYYTGFDLIGFREEKNKPWKIYYFGQYRPSGFSNYNKVRNLFRDHYLGNGRFKNDYASYWDGIHNDTLGMARSITFPNEDNRVDIKFGYNIDDVHFWDKSIVWKKGSRIPGYYSFQTKGNVAPGYIDSPLVNIPRLDYPDSLLNLYK